MRRGHPHTAAINALIQQRLAEAEAERIRLLAAREPVTRGAQGRPRAGAVASDFFTFAGAYVDDLRRRGQIR